MIIRRANPKDLIEIQKLFVETISIVCKADYNDDQIRAWVSSIENNKRWRDILIHQFVLVSLAEEKITGFCTLANGNYIDLLYIHKDYQRQGIARKLYTVIEKEAKQRGQTELTADVSKTARLFFEKAGFNVLKEQSVYLKGVELINYKMMKKIV